MLKILQTLQSPYFLSVLSIVEIQRMHRTDVFNSLRNVKTEPIFNDVKENRKYFMVLKSISIYSQESIHKECPHIFRNFCPPPPGTTVDIWLTSPPPPILPPRLTAHCSCEYKIWIWMRLQISIFTTPPSIRIPRKWVRRSNIC